MPRRIVGHIAGTWGGGTNVVRLVQALRPHDDQGNAQLSFFDIGLGMRGFLSRYVAGATGFGISILIKELYFWLSMQYRPDDQIYLFGFSRGAYAVRSVAGLINRCGIVRRPERAQIEHAFRLYKDGDRASQAAFKAEHSYPRVDIRMIGVWDTVGTLGLPGRMLEWFNPFASGFHDVSLNPGIHRACHALAIDEQRKQFLPVLWDEPGVSPGMQVEQVWFAGSHGDIGGQTLRTDHSLSEITLRWMMDKAREQGLAFSDEAVAALRPAYDGKLHDSRAGLGRLWPKAVRTIPVSASTLVHRTVKQRVEDPAIHPRYRPEALRKHDFSEEHCTVVGQAAGRREHPG